MTWKLEGFVSEAGNLVQHIVPTDDLYEHKLMPGCWCDPQVDPRDFVVVHNAADEREKFETGERKSS